MKSELKEQIEKRHTQTTNLQSQQPARVHCCALHTDPSRTFVRERDRAADRRGGQDLDLRRRSDASVFSFLTGLTNLLHPRL